MTETITTPWSNEQVAALNEHQRRQFFHPYTCPSEICEPDNDRVLKATADGWRCSCGQYTQNWAHKP